MMIVIVDYGVGNLGSILNMLKKIGAEAVISADPGEIAQANKLILPGVGAFDHGMQNLYQRNLVAALNNSVLQQRIPILGICLGMQLFTIGSEEGQLPGLGWINARTIRFGSGKQNHGIRVPHMGWNSPRVVRPGVLFRDTGEDMRYYFVHSYHAICNEKIDVTTVTTYGSEFVSSFERRNVLGVQFHPEKSHKFGMRVLENFVTWVGPYIPDGLTPVIESKSRLSAS
jgi:glutamine amidotransferase